MSEPWLFIMAGGSGTRFWPRSRKKLPKQLLKVGGKTLLSSTIERLSSLVPQERVIIICTEELEDPTRKEIGSFQGTILCEPQKKNTAPCLMMAMEWLRCKDPNATAIIVPTDHWITDIPTYLKTLTFGVDFVKKNNQLLTIGIAPTRAETGYGYIRCGKTVDGGPVCFVDRFLEKPSMEVAETIIQDTSYFWNAGIFIWSVSTFFQEIEKVALDLQEVFRDYKPGENTNEDKKILEDIYQKTPNISIDFALMEKSKNVAVLPANFDWNDLGSFQSLYELYPETEGGVGYAKRIMAIDSTSNLIDCPGKTVALLGATNMMIVDTGDVLLVAAKEQSQLVQKFVARIQEEGDLENLL